MIIFSGKAIPKENKKNKIQNKAVKRNYFT